MAKAKSVIIADKEGNVFRVNKSKFKMLCEAIVSDQPYNLEHLGTFLGKPEYTLDEDFITTMAPALVKEMEILNGSEDQE